MAKNDFFYRDNNTLKRIDISTIEGLAVDGNFVRFIADTDIKPYMIRVTLKEALARLPEKEFAQISRSVAIAIRVIKEIKRDTVLVQFTGEEPEELTLTYMYREGLLNCITILETEVKRQSRSASEVLRRKLRKERERDGVEGFFEDGV